MNQGHTFPFQNLTLFQTKNEGFVYDVVHTVPTQVSSPQEQNSNIVTWCGHLFVNVSSFIECIVIFIRDQCNAIINRRRQCMQKISAS